MIMFLSIVITTKNRKKQLYTCIESVKKAVSNVKVWEIIIVDDNSSDGTEMLSLKDLGITSGKIIHNNTRQWMMVKARNEGVKAARGKYILFIDDDNTIDAMMIDRLVSFANKNPMFGIIGPSMYYYSSKQKYLDYQTINLFTGKTYGIIDNSSIEWSESDGIPNVFLIKKEVFDRCGLFDESLIQTYTEPDFALSAKKRGFNCAIVKKAKTYHHVNPNLSPRSLGGEYSQKAYCLMRNRSVIVARYGAWYHKIIYLLFCSWFWPTIYSLFMITPRRFDLIRLYWRGFVDGIIYVLTGKLNNSLRQSI